MAATPRVHGTPPSAPRAVSRRFAIPGALASAAVAGSAGPAAAADDDLSAYLPARFKGEDKLLSRQDRHLASRFSYGVTPDLARDVRKAGGARSWFERQLKPNSIKDKKAGRLQAWWPSLKRGPKELWERQITGVEGGWEVMNNYARWSMMRRMVSKRQVFEVMAEFWENHLHVPALGDAQFTHRVDYGNQIREHALGRFDEMLLATSTHPAMLIYLDAAESTKEHPNENLGRELLELHTVGEGSYGEKDVKGSARILTGWSVDMWETWRPEYHEDDHYLGTVKVKGFKDKNRKANGKRLTADYLRYLAHHPDTAEHLATKLCEKFIGDKASKSLVKKLAKVYLDNDTAIVPVLRALVDSDQFRHSIDDKVRDPGGGPGGDVPRAPHRRAAAARRRGHLQRVRHRRDDLAGRRHRAGPVQLGDPRRRAARQRVVVLTGPADGLHGRALAARARALPRRGGALQGPHEVDARDRRSASTSSWTTSASSCCTGTRTPGCSRRAPRPRT